MESSSASSSSKASTSSKAADTSKPSDAEAPGPISPEHESGSFEQTMAVEDARVKLREAQGGTAK